MHTNSTEYYNLPQYTGNDIINPLVDTNGAYETIDTTMKDFEDRITDLENSGGGSSSTTLTAKGLTFSFKKNGNCCHVDVTGTLTATIVDDTNWSETVAEDYRPASTTVSVPVFPANIYNEGLGIIIASTGVISADSSVGTIPVDTVIKCTFDYPVA